MAGSPLTCGKTCVGMPYVTPPQATTWHHWAPGCCCSTTPCMATASLYISQGLCFTPMCHVLWVGPPPPDATFCLGSGKPSSSDDPSRKGAALMGAHPSPAHRAMRGWPPLPPETMRFAFWPDRWSEPICLVQQPDVLGHRDPSPITYPPSRQG